MLNNTQMSEEEKLCDNCNYDGNIDRQDLELNICAACCKLEPRIMMTQTYTIANFPVTKKDLETIRYTTCKSSWSKRSFAKLYVKIFDFPNHLLTFY